MKITRDGVAHGTVWVYAKVDGAADMRVLGTSLTMSPTQIMITYQLTKNGTYEPIGWRVSGGRRLKSGAASAKAIHETSGGFYDRAGVTAWIRDAADLWNPAPLPPLGPPELELSEREAYRP